MRAGRSLRLAGIVLGITAALLAQPRTLPAQAGLRSNLSQVALVVHVAPRASIQEVGPMVETGRSGQLREASVHVRFATNTGYRLVVSGGQGANGSRVWVRAVDGEYRELVPGVSVIVARGGRAAGQWEREVSYRIESATDVVALPVRYDIVVDATI